MARQFEIRWDLDRMGFCAQVEAIIEQAMSNGTVLPLPLSLGKGMSAVDLIAAVLADIDCSGCNALCCREDGVRNYVSLMPTEATRLYSAFPEMMMKAPHETKGGLYKLYQPCPFLEGNRCTIYELRPLVCRFYPFQFGALTADKWPMAAVSPNCPEARQIARTLYTVAWDLRNAFGGLKVDEINRVPMEEAGL